MEKIKEILNSAYNWIVENSRWKYLFLGFILGMCGWKFVTGINFGIGAACAIGFHEYWKDESEDETILSTQLVILIIGSVFGACLNLF